jgi:Mn-containing catalase
MSRLERRAVQKELKKLQAKAKEDMLKWAMSLDYTPSQQEGEAWKAGYIAGINRNIVSK